MSLVKSKETIIVDFNNPNIYRGFLPGDREENWLNSLISWRFLSKITYNSTRSINRLDLVLFTDEYLISFCEDQWKVRYQ